MTGVDILHPIAQQQRETDKLRNPSFRVTHGLRADELWLLPPSFDGRADEICSVEIILEGQVEVPERRLKLSIHETFLTGSAGSAMKENRDRVQLRDATSMELALWLFEADGAGQTSGWAAQSMFGMLCARLKELLARENTVNHRRFEGWQLSELSDVLLDQVEDGISVAATAARCRLSACQFSRVFKSTYGMPLHKYVTAERVRRAQRRLSETDDRIAEIALDCGFADQSSFTRRFSTVTGVPPATWRRRAKQEQGQPTPVAV